MVRSQVLSDYLKDNDVPDILIPRRRDAPQREQAWLDQVVSEWEPSRQPFTILEFCKRIQPGKLCLVHYSGAEDRKHHGQPQMDAAQLSDWAVRKVAESGLSAAVHIPFSGEEVRI
jgi:hypothetical protein